MNLIYLIMGNGLSPQLGGSLIRSINIMKNLEKRNDVNIKIITTVGGKKACLSEGVKSDFIVIPSNFKKEETNLFDRLISYFVSTLIFPFYLKNIPKSDIIYTDSDYFCDVIPALWIKLFKKTKWVSMIHHKISLRKDNLLSFIITLIFGLLQRMDWFLIKLFSDTVFFYDSPMGHKIKNNYFIKKRSRFVFNGFDYKRIIKIKKKNNKIIYDACFIGGLRPNKGIYDIVPIWKMVVKQLPNAKLVLVGSGSKEHVLKIKKQIISNNLNKNIVLVGGQTNEKALTYLSKSRLFFFPSHEEGWGIVMCEALALDKPIVCYNLPVFNIFKGSIFRIKRFNKNDFAKKIIYLLKNNIKLKPSNVNQFKWCKISENEYKLFKEIIKS